MQKNKILYLLLFFAVLLTDQLTKQFFSNLLPTHQNPGFILQTFGDASSMTRIVFVSVLYSYIALAYFLIQAVLVHPLPLLRLGLTIFLGAVSGNALDRARLGFVNDFIPFHFLNSSIYFNVADAWMWIGTAFIVYSIFADQDKIWFPDSTRKKYLINPTFQFKVATQVALLTAVAMACIIIFSYTYMIHILKPSTDTDGHIFLLCTIPLALLFTVLTFLLGIIFSHRAVGPIYALDRHVDLLLKGEDPTFKTRKNDDFKGLENMALKLKSLRSSSTGSN